ncbi:putative histone H2A-like protein, partial [Trifolium pratense]
SKLLGDVTIANGGVMPNIHNLLLPKNTGPSSKAAAEDE